MRFAPGLCVGGTRRQHTRTGTCAGAVYRHLFFGDARYPDEDYVPSFELIEDHGDSYEMVFITDDDTGSTVLFIPKSADMDAELLSLCQAFAVTSNQTYP